MPDGWQTGGGDRVGAFSVLAEGRAQRGALVPAPSELYLRGWSEDPNVARSRRRLQTAGRGAIEGKRNAGAPVGVVVAPFGAQFGGHRAHDSLAETLG